MSDIVVTGAGSGIGAAVTRRLLAAGHRVVAIVRSPARAEAIAASSVVPLVVDLAGDEVASRLRAALAEAGLAAAPLRGLVHCAGAPSLAPLETASREDLRASLQLHALALVELAQVLLPALRRGHGRIVAIGSVGGRVATPLMGAYGASKFALVALTTALRHELHGQGIAVSLVEPGVVDTPMLPAGAALFDRARAALPTEATQYTAAIDRAAVTYRRAIARPTPADRVARAVEHALFARRPRPRYLVGADAHIAAALQWLLPVRAFEWLVRRL
ncbi:MAG: SDR family NAD(P)-dependent oxidoreductase [Nannocystaceae bacterium]|nr:SDR family NAD(P)-dependent oxidoreductase [Nannocystaceae bacterium]